jgi:hypothetical protein
MPATAAVAAKAINTNQTACLLRRRVDDGDARGGSSVLGGLIGGSAVGLCVSIPPTRTTGILPWNGAGRAGRAVMPGRALGLLIDLRARETPAAANVRASYTSTAMARNARNCSSKGSTTSISSKTSHATNKTGSEDIRNHPQSTMRAVLSAGRSPGRCDTIHDEFGNARHQARSVLTHANQHGGEHACEHHVAARRAAAAECRRAAAEHGRRSECRRFGTSADSRGGIALVVSVVLLAGLGARIRRTQR